MSQVERAPRAEVASAASRPLRQPAPARRARRPDPGREAPSEQRLQGAAVQAVALGDGSERLFDPKVRIQELERDERVARHSE
jgi:hypothetical protein